MGFLRIYATIIIIKMIYNKYKNKHIFEIKNNIPIKNKLFSIEIHNKRQNIYMSISLSA